MFYPPPLTTYQPQVQHIIRAEKGVPFDNRYYELQSCDQVIDYLRQKGILNKSTAHIEQRIAGFLNEFGFNKTFAAKILGVSRTTLYDWLKGKTSKIRFENAEKIEWLERFREHLPDEIWPRVNLYKNRLLGDEQTTLEDLLLSANEDAQKVAVWLTESVESTKTRRPFGSWKKKKNKGPILHIPEAYSDNG